MSNSQKDSADPNPATLAGPLRGVEREEAHRLDIAALIAAPDVPTQFTGHLWREAHQCTVNAANTLQNQEQLTVPFMLHAMARVFITELFHAQAVVTKAGAELDNAMSMQALITEVTRETFENHVKAMGVEVLAQDVQDALDGD